MTTATEKLKVSTPQTHLEKLQKRIDEFNIDQTNEVIDAVEESVKEFLDDVMEAIDRLKKIPAIPKDIN